MLTILQSDTPTSDDEFGPHKKIASEICKIVKSESDFREQPHLIGLLGDWGSGKSSVVRMVSSGLTSDETSSGGSAFFVYDAWSHGGDELRRAFLDAFCEKIDPERTDSELTSIRNEVWDQTQRTETTSEPVLRRHAIILLLSLLAVPIGMRFYNTGQDYSTLVNALSLTAICLPVIAAAFMKVTKHLPWPKILQRLLLGTDKAEVLAGLNLWSPFLQRVHGQMEVRKTSSPIDSVSAFNGIFRKICARALVQLERVVVVIDNIDRLDRDQARAFWSTMQSFFDRSNWGLGHEVLKRVYVIVPFSPDAVRGFFKEESSDTGVDSAQSFLDKTFDLSMTVPPPIQVNLRRYLLGKLEHSFPEHPLEILEVVRDLYDYHRSGQSAVGQVGDAETTRRTPREMKLFINQLVSLYRVREDDVPLPVMAAYVLIKRDVDKEGLRPQQLLSDPQKELLPRNDRLMQELAAIHFGVSVQDAAQVLLADPIKEALGNNDEAALVELAKSSGFVDVLKIVVSEFGRDVSVASLFRVGELLTRLSPGTEHPWGAVWSAIYTKMHGTRVLGALPRERSFSLKLFRDRLYPTQQAHLGQMVHAGLSGDWTRPLSNRPSEEKEDARKARLGQSLSIVEIIADLVEIDPSNELGSIAFSLLPDGYIALASWVSSEPRADNVLRRLTVRVSQGKIEQALRRWPLAGTGPKQPYEFVQSLGRLLGADYDWSAVAGALKSAFTEKVTGELSQVEALKLLMTIGAQFSKSGASDAIASLINDGQVGEAVAAEPENAELAAVCIAAVFCSAPNTSPQALASSGRRTDRPLGALLAGTGLTSDQIKVIRQTLQQVRRMSTFMNNLALREQLQLVGALVLIDAIEAGATFAAGSWTLLRLQPVIVAMKKRTEVSGFYERQEKRKDILDGLNKGTVSSANAFTYRMIASTTWGKSSRALRNRLQAYVEGATADRWGKVIDGSEPENDQLLLIVGQLEEMGLSVGLGAPVSDAIVEEVRSALSGGSQLNTSVRALAGTLDSEVLRNLPERLWSVLLEAKSAAGLSGLISVFGDALTHSGSVPLGGLLNGPAAIILSEPRIETVRWLAKVIDSRKDDLPSAGGAAAELRSRVTAAHKSSQDRSLRKELNALKALLPTVERRKKATVPA